MALKEFVPMGHLTPGLVPAKWIYFMQEHYLGALNTRHESEATPCVDTSFLFFQGLVRWEVLEPHQTIPGVGTSS